MEKTRTLEERITANVETAMMMGLMIMMVIKDKEEIHEEIKKIASKTASEVLKEVNA